MDLKNGIRSERPRKDLNVLTPDRAGALAGRGEDVLSGQHDYYNLPLVKKAHWKWEVVLYFFLGGASAGAYLAATVADFVGSKKDRQLIRFGRYMSLVGMIASPILLIKDLGRPERFLHMLRILKFRSVMSLGSWALSTFGIFCGLTATHQAAKDGLFDWFPLGARILKALPIKLIEVVGSFFGLFVASYTGVLLSSTAVPIWARARHILGPLFLTSGISTGFAALSCALSFNKSNRETLERLENAELIAMTTEIALLATLPKTLGPLGKPLSEGRVGKLFLFGTVGGGLLLPLLARLGWKIGRRKISPSVNVGFSLMTLVGGLILRYVWIVVGRTSADDPYATHYYNALERGEGHR